MPSEAVSDIAPDSDNTLVHMPSQTFQHLSRICLCSSISLHVCVCRQRHHIVRTFLSHEIASCSDPGQESRSHQPTQVNSWFLEGVCLSLSNLIESSTPRTQEQLDIVFQDSLPSSPEFTCHCDKQCAQWRQRRIFCQARRQGGHSDARRNMSASVQSAGTASAIVIPLPQLQVQSSLLSHDQQHW